MPFSFISLPPCGKKFYSLDEGLSNWRCIASALYSGVFYEKISHAPSTSDTTTDRPACGRNEAADRRRHRRPVGHIDRRAERSLSFSQRPCAANQVGRHF